MFPRCVTHVRPHITSDGLCVLAVRIAPELLSAEAAELVRLIERRSADHSLVLIDDQSVFANTPYEAEIVFAELAAGDGYLHGMRPLPDSPVILDVGAHIGLFSLDVLRRRPEARVIAVEPFGPSYSALARNLELYGRREVPVAVRAAVGQHPGTTSIAGCRGGSMLAATRDGPDARTLGSTRDTFARSLPRLLGRGAWGREIAEAAAADALDRLFTPVRATVLRVTVSQLIEANHLDRVDLLKVDVEGDEARVLAGVDAAHWPRIGAVVVEADGAALPQVCATLSRHGLAHAVTEPPIKSAAFARDCFIVRAQRGPAPRADRGPAPRADRGPAAARPAVARRGSAVAEISMLFHGLRLLAREHRPTEHMLVDVCTDPRVGPVSDPWLERGSSLGLSHGRAWARHLLSTYLPAASADADLPRALTGVVGGDWTSAGPLLRRHPVADVVAARMATDQLIQRAVRSTFGAAGRSDARVWSQNRSAHSAREDRGGEEQP